MIQSIKDTFIRALLAPSLLRRRIIFGIRSEHFGELGITVPVSGRVCCPIPHEAAWSSFHEVFVRQEYAPAFAKMPLPRRWLDLGCYAGFFTVYVAMLRDCAGLPEDFEALLIDGDSRSEAAVSLVNATAAMRGRLHFARGVIAAGGQAAPFIERPYLSSSLAAWNTDEGRRQVVPVVGEEEILARFPAPYDLIKLDIEGAELDFLRAYPRVLAGTRFLVAEWHHTSRGGVDAEGLRQSMAERSFRLTSEIVPAHPVGCAGDGASCGVLLFERVNQAG